MPATREKRCDCCDLLVQFCGRAAARRERDEARRQREEVLARPGWFPSQYRGVCGECWTWFEPGTPISRMPDGGYRAWCCVSIG